MIKLEEALTKLTENYQQAIDEKVKCQEEADKTGKTIALANRLVGGLSSEKVRWSHSVQTFQEQAKKLPGDVLIIAGFVSYLGCFTKQYRVELFERRWLPYVNKLPEPLPLSIGFAGANVLGMKIFKDLGISWGI